LFRLRWLVGPYSLSGSPFRLDGDVMAVCFQWLEVTWEFCDSFIPVCLLSVMASKLTQLLPALGFARTVATSVRGYYPQWPSGLCGCYLRLDCYLC
jgi:hypothetical protein